MRTSRSARAFFCTSSGVLLLWAGTLLADEARNFAAEIELARSPEVYLVIEPATCTLQVKARGVLLQSMPLRRVAALGYRRTFERAPLPVLELPRLFEVTEEAAGGERPIVSPPALVSLRDGVESSAAPLPEEVEKPAAPASYQVAMGAEWRLRVEDGTSSLGLPAALGATLAEGWRRLAALRISQPPPAGPPFRLALDLDPEDARNLHHLLVPGTRMLLLALPSTGPPNTPRRCWVD